MGGLNQPLPALKMLEGGHEPRNAGGFQKVEDARKRMQPCYHLDFSPVRPFSDF